MTDHDTEIQDAYRRIATAAAPSGDPLPRVEAAIGRRRVVRRSVAAVAVLAVVGGVGGAVALSGDGSGDDLAAVDQPSAAPVPTGPVSTLVVTRLDGTPYLFDASTLSLSCGEDQRTLSLRTAKPALSADGKDLLAPLLDVEVRTDLVRPGQVFTVPHEGIDGSSDDRGLTFFFATPEGGRRANELSSAESGGSGTVTVEEATCGPTPRLALSVDATLGSEVEQAPMAVAGGYRY